MNFEQAVEALGLSDPFTRESLTAEELMATLKEDVVLAVERPGSWEGANMLEMLLCHGFLEEW